MGIPVERRKINAIDFSAARERETNSGINSRRIGIRRERDRGCRSFGRGCFTTERGEKEEIICVRRKRQD